MKNVIVLGENFVTALYVLLFFSLSLSLKAQEKKSPKLRDLSPDRPHQTESPITVDKGHIMIEADVVNFTQKKIPNDQLSTLGFGFINFKVGFHKRMDIEVISGVYSNDSYKHQSSPDKNNYVSDLTFRYKLNLLGNDSGSFALAIMPIMRTTNFFQQKWQVLNGGILVNIEKELQGKFGLGYTGGLSSFSVKPLSTQYELFSTLSFDYKLIGALRNFVEVSHRYNKSADFLNTYSFDSGLIFTPGKNLQFDAGFYFYLPAKTPFFFIGGTIRI